MIINKTANIFLMIFAPIMPDNNTPTTAPITPNSAKNVVVFHLTLPCLEYKISEKIATGMKNIKFASVALFCFIPSVNVSITISTPPPPMPSEPTAPDKKPIIIFTTVSTKKHSHPRNYQHYRKNVFECFNAYFIHYKCAECCTE